MEKKKIIQYLNRIVAQENSFQKKNISYWDEKNTSEDNKSIFLEVSIADLSKIQIYKFCHGYFKEKYNEKAKLCYIESIGFVILIKTEDFFKEISKDIED